MSARALAVTSLLLLPLVPELLVAQRGEFDGARRMLGDPNEFWSPPDYRGNVSYSGRFTFARIKYRGYGHFSGREGPGWSHDYPRAETNLMRIMAEVTTMRPFIESGERVGGVILALDDPELFRYPVAYLSEPGGWQPTDSEVAGLGQYLQKGGFLIVDDFDGWSSDRDLEAFRFHMNRALPGHRLVPLDGSHPIFDSFFKVDLTMVRRRQEPVYYAIFPDNDPTRRIMAIINYNNDIGEWWQWSSRGFAPIAVSNEAYKLGVNYLIYALTH
ncbi:MAG: DUF4159 domain-containing protein [Gemmatimonadaceae bacterium]